MRGGERGVVLVTVVVLLLAATLLVQGAFLLARGFAGSGEAGWEAVRVRRAAAGRLGAGVAGGGPLVSDTAWVAAVADVETRLTVHLLGPELALVGGGARGRHAEWWAGQLVWRPEPAARAAAAAAALRAGGTVREEGGGQVQASAGGDCAEGTPLPAIRPLPDTVVHLGPLSPERWAEVATPWVFDPPCGAACAAAVLLAEGGGIITGGPRAGVFLSRGDLTLTGNTRLRGRLLVDGDLTLTDSARVEGAVDVTGSVVVADAARIAGDRCALAEVWRAGVATDLGPIPLDTHPWPLWGRPP